MKMKNFMYRIWDGQGYDRISIDEATKHFYDVAEIEIFIGSYDTNGEKLYENDIVEATVDAIFHDNLDELHGKTLMFKIEVGDGGVWYKTLAPDERMYNGYFLCDIIKIGNIHENKDTMDEYKKQNSKNAIRKQR